MANITLVGVANELLVSLLAALSRRDPETIDLMAERMRVALENPADEQQEAELRFALGLVESLMPKASG